MKFTERCVAGGCQAARKAQIITLFTSCMYSEILNANQKFHSYFNYIKYTNIFAFLSFIMTTLI